MDSHTLPLADEGQQQQQALMALFQRGSVILRGALSSTDACTVATAARLLSRYIRGLLSQRGVAYVGDGVAPFRFQEVASRGYGRIDFRCGLELPPFAAAIEAVTQALTPSLDWAFGSDWVLNYKGIVDSFPASHAQAMHRDGDFLFPMEMPPHAVTVFVALEDLTEASNMGCPKTHIYRHRVKDVDGLVSTELAAGDCLMFDYRLLHCGTANTSEKSRPLLYLVFSKPWFKDQVNFGSDPLITPAAQVSLEDVLLRGVVWPQQSDDGF